MLSGFDDAQCRPLGDLFISRLLLKIASMSPAGDPAAGVLILLEEITMRYEL